MSKVGNAINMLLLLKSRKRMKIDELARELEVAPRQIRRYRDDLEQAGFVILSVSGPDGGYELFSPVRHLPLAISREEHLAMKILGKEMEKHLPHYKKEYTSVMAKFEYLRYFPEGSGEDGLVRENSPSDAFMVKKHNLIVDLDAERKKLDDLQRAVITRRKVRMAYTSNTSGPGERTVHPYALVEYDGGIYLIAHCEKRSQKMYFKLVRIGDYEVLEEKFEREEDFDMEAHVRSCFGIFEGEEMKVSVKIRPPFIQTTREKTIAYGQVITDLPEENTIRFEAVTQGLEGITGWILSMGPAAEVLGPPELKEAVKEKLDEARSQYT